MSSLGEISVTIQAVNQATPTFEAISSDAASMGDNVKAAGSSFTDMQVHAEAASVSLRTVASGIRETAMMGTQLTSLAQDFGLVDSQTSKYVRTVLLAVEVVSSCARMVNFLTVMTTGHTAAVAVEGATETATVGAVTASSSALGVKTAVTSFATAAQNALNVSHATFLALTGVGIGVIIAAAAAIAYFASQMNNATSSVKAYNSAATTTTTNMQSISRAGAQALSRKGVETA